MAAAAAGLHEVERARLVGGHGLAVGHDAAGRARRHRPLRGDDAGAAARLPQRPRRQLVAAQRRLPRAAPGPRPADLPRPSGRAARPGRRRRPAERARHGHPRRHGRDVDDAPPAARAGRPGRPASATCRRGWRRQPLRPLRRCGLLRLAVERLRPERPHRRSDGGHAPSGAKRSSKRPSRRSVRRSSRCARFDVPRD